MPQPRTAIVRPRAVEGARVRCGVDAEREAADHRHAGLGQLAGERAREALAGSRGSARAHHRDRRFGASAGE